MPRRTSRSPCFPVAVYIPFAAHHQHALILRKQSEAGEPTKKRIWQQIVQAKIRNQAGSLLLHASTAPQRRASAELQHMATQVLSGDSGNLEAFAAARYFVSMFGKGFVRGAEEGDLRNSMLNYGYALVRAAVTRALCGAGLHPSFGVFHHNRYDPYALADDAMEPLRPLVDSRVKSYAGQNTAELTPEIKRYLYPILTATVSLDGQRLPLMPALEQYSANLRRCILSESRRLNCPTDLLLD
jgi:CRISPR-associated protein Cas1